MKDVKAIEVRHVHHWKRTNTRPDLHIVKELIHYKDGTSKPNLRLIQDYKRPIWITKLNKRVHKDKREFEKIENCDMYMSVESDLGNNIARRIGMSGYSKNQLWDVRDSPYIYGVDISSSVLLNKEYKEKWSTINTHSTICYLDIEADVNTGIISALTTIFDKEIKTYINKSLVKDIQNVKEKVLKRLIESAPKDKIDIEDFNIDVTVYEDNIEVIKETFINIHSLQPDILTSWGSYDFTTIIENLEDYNIDPIDIFTDPSIPEEYREMKVFKDSGKFVSDSGVPKQRDFHELWNVYSIMASFKIIDAMCTYNYVRVNTPKVYGGYGINNIVKTEKVGSKLYIGNCRFADGSIAWHSWMSRHEPINYIVYNIWDVVIMKLLEDKTNDMKLVMGLLSGSSSLDVFNSGPKKIINDMFFYAKEEHNMVIGTKGKKYVGPDHLLLNKWIITLEAYRTISSGYRCIKNDPDLETAFRTQTDDADQTSGYPRDTTASGLSKATTEATILKIGNVEKETMKSNNMNLLYGDVNYMRYCKEVLNLPHFSEVHNFIDKKIREEQVA